jgi:hypothetical protein
MKAILIIYLAFTIIDILLTAGLVFSLRWHLRKKYAHVTFNVTSPFEKFCGIIRVILTCAIPLWNVLYCFSLIFKSEHTIQAALDEVEKQIASAIERD